MASLEDTGVLMALPVPSNQTVPTDTQITGSGSGRLSGTKIAINTSVSIALIILSGLVAGLTLGLLSLDRIELEVVKRSGSSNKRKWAARVIPLLKNPHWLLVSLVLVNAACNTSLPIFLDRMVSPAVAIVLATTAVLIFGEILPQAVCARHGIVIGGALSWVVRLILLLTSPVSWPAGRLLDWALGREEKAHGRRQLKALVSLHAKHEGLGGNLMEDEIKIIRGVLDLAGKDASAAMTPLDRVFALPADAVLSRRCLAAVLRTGRSRVPVWRPGPAGYPEFLGFLLTKEILQQVDQSRPLRAGQASMRVLPHLSAHTSLFDLLKFFSSGATHMAVLTVPEPEVASLLASLAGPASTSSTRGSDSSSDDEEEGSASSRSSSPSSSRSFCSRGNSGSIDAGRASSTIQAATTARSTASGHGRHSLGSLRWRTAEHRIRAVLRLLSGGRRRHGMHLGSGGSRTRGSLEADAHVEHSAGMDKVVVTRALAGEDKPLDKYPTFRAGTEAQTGSDDGNVASADEAGKIASLEALSAPTRGEVQISNMGAMAAAQLSRTAAAVLPPEGVSAEDEDGVPALLQGSVEPDVPGTALLEPGEHTTPVEEARPLPKQPQLQQDEMAAGCTSTHSAAPTPLPRVVAYLQGQTHMPYNQNRRSHGQYRNQSPGAQLRSLRTYGLGHAAARPPTAPANVAATTPFCSTVSDPTGRGLEAEVCPSASEGAEGMNYGRHADMPARGSGGDPRAAFMQRSHHGAHWLNSAAAAAELLVPVGIITLEDVIEELMQVEILDETDTAGLGGDGQAVAPQHTAWLQNHT